MNDHQLLPGIRTKKTRLKLSWISAGLLMAAGLARAETDGAEVQESFPPAVHSERIIEAELNLPMKASSISLSNQSITPADKARGLRIDYQPFNSNFSMSAGSFPSPAGESHLIRYNNKAYLGVGWKKLVDETRNLGVRVDIGAFYETEQEAPTVVSPSVNSLKSILTEGFSDPTDARWQPMITLGVSYRF